MERGLPTIPALGLMSVGLALAGCSDGSDVTGTGTPPPTPTELQVSVATTGEDLDLSAFLVTIGQEPQHIGLDDTVTFGALSAGSYTVQLDDVADNCSVGGGATRQVSVTDGNTTDVAFAVSCVALPAATVDVTGTWSGRLSDCACHTLEYVLEQDGDEVTALSIDYGNTAQGFINEFSGVGRVSGSTLTLFYEGRRQFPTLGQYVRVTATLDVSGDEMTGNDTEQQGLWGATILIMTRQ